MSGDDVYYTDIFGIEWSKEDYDYLNDPANLYCAEHKRHVPCRDCLGDDCVV